jgi:hypothetical protein
MSIVLSSAPLVVVSITIGPLAALLRMKSVPVAELNSTDSGSATP